MLSMVFKGRPHVSSAPLSPDFVESHVSHRSASSMHVQRWGANVIGAFADEGLEDEETATDEATDEPMRREAGQSVISQPANGQSSNGFSSARPEPISVSVSARSDGLLSARPGTNSARSETNSAGSGPSSTHSGVTSARSELITERSSGGGASAFAAMPSSVVPDAQPGDMERLPSAFGKPLKTVPLPAGAAYGASSTAPTLAKLLAAGAPCSAEAGVVTPQGAFGPAAVAASPRGTAGAAAASAAPAAPRTDGEAMLQDDESVGPPPSEPPPRLSSYRADSFDI